MKHFSKVSSSLFSGSLQKAGISKQVSASQHVGHAIDIFKERFGDGVALHAKPKYIKDRTLMIEIAHPAIAEEIRRQEEALISELNKRIGHPEVVRLQFGVPGREEEYSE